MERIADVFSAWMRRCAFFTPRLERFIIGRNAFNAVNDCSEFSMASTSAMVIMASLKMDEPTRFATTSRRCVVITSYACGCLLTAARTVPGNGHVMDQMLRGTQIQRRSRRSFHCKNYIFFSFFFRVTLPLESE